jgi:GMP synthase-like glutamine amidotransferase
MMRILVFQHVAVEHPGIFRDFWRKAGHDWRAVELDEGEPIPDLDDYDLLLAMGGPMDVWQEDIHPWFVAEKAAIGRWVRDLNRPYLGICLGHQLLAEAVGGKVGLMKAPEVGFADVRFTAEGLADEFFAGFDAGMETFQWHGAEITQLPYETTVLAANSACPVQAMRWRDRAYGLQYHIEITPATVPEWQAIPAYASSLEAALGPVEAPRLASAVAPKLPAFAAAAQRINDNLERIIRQFA